MFLCGYSPYQGKLIFSYWSYFSKTINWEDISSTVAVASFTHVTLLGESFCIVYPESTAFMLSFK